MCILDANMIVGVDLMPGSTAEHIIFEDVPCPNDICVDDSNDDILYVCGGKGVQTQASKISRRKVKDGLLVVLPFLGFVYKLDVKTVSVTVMLSGSKLKSLAGISFLKGKVRCVSFNNKYSFN